jgi:hypothetical protein
MTMTPDDLERLVDRALADLPTPRAPRSLRPRVLAAVEPVPIIGRPWFTWPWAAQVGSIVASLAIVVAVAWYWPLVAAQVTARLPETVRVALGLVDSAALTGSAIGRVVQVTWGGVVMPLAKLVLIVTVMICTACAVCVAALGRLAPGGVSQS